MVAVPSAQQHRRHDLIVVCIAWAPVLWAGFSMYLLADPLAPPLRVPATIALLAFLSGAICIIGGLASMVYLLAVAGTWRTALSGLCAIVCNFGYVWWWYSYVIARLR